VKGGIEIVSALGAGGKSNPCQLHVGRLGEVFSDPIGTSLLKRMRKKAAEKVASGESEIQSEIAWWEDVPNRVWVVYSGELQKVSLLPLPEGVGRAEELGSQPNFRVRVMPVMPPVPAAFGAALASHALSLLSGDPPAPPPLPVPALTLNYQRKLYQKFVATETKIRKAQPSAVRLSFDDVCTVVCDVFRCRCALTGCRLHDPGRRQFCLIRWDPGRDATVDNVIFASVDAAERHDREGMQIWPQALIAEVQKSFREGLRGRAASFMEQAMGHATGNAARVTHPMLAE